MTYRKLSELVLDVQDSQKTELFVRLFRNAVREGLIEAAELPGQRFVLPQLKRIRGSDGQTRQVEAREMVVKVTPALEGWMTQTLAEIESMGAGRRVRVKPSIEAIKEGAVDFEELARATRARMQNRFERGRQLGESRGKKTASKGRARKK